MTYKEIDPSTWTYENEDDFIEGSLVQKQEDIGVNNSMLYSIKTPEGVKNVWGSAILDQRMSFVEVGEKIKITYKGLSEAKAGKNPAKIFKVEVDDEPSEDSESIPVVKPGMTTPEVPEDTK